VINARRWRSPDHPDRGAASIAVLPNGKEALVSNLNDGTLTVLNTAT
jgi:hypothetical protein